MVLQGDGDPTAEGVSVHLGLDLAADLLLMIAAGEAWFPGNVPGQGHGKFQLRNGQGEAAEQRQGKQVFLGVDRLIQGVFQGQQQLSRRGNRQLQENTVAIFCGLDLLAVDQDVPGGGRQGILQRFGAVQLQPQLQRDMAAAIGMHRGIGIGLPGRTGCHGREKQGNDTYKKRQRYAQSLHGSHRLSLEYSSFYHGFRQNARISDQM